jgi:hypothetical protein
VFIVLNVIENVIHYNIGKFHEGYLLCYKVYLLVISTYAEMGMPAYAEMGMPAYAEMGMPAYACVHYRPTPVRNL